MRAGRSPSPLSDLVRLAHWPWLTLIVLCLSGAGFIAQTMRPEIIGLLQWDAARVGQGEIWRLLTGLFVHTNGWAQITLNLSVLIVLGTYVEQRWSRWAWVAAFLAGTFSAEITGTLWYPMGGGNSVGLGGLFGLALVGTMAGATGSWLLRTVLPVAAFCIAAYLILRRDIHGPPIFAGALMGLAALNLGGLRGDDNG